MSSLRGTEARRQNQVLVGKIFHCIAHCRHSFPIGKFGLILVKCRKCLVTYWTSVQTLWSQFGQVPKLFWSHFGQVYKIWALFGHIYDKCPNFLITFWTCVQIRDTFWSHFGQVSNLWQLFGHILGTFWTRLSKMFQYSHRSAAPKNFFFENLGPEWEK